MDAILAFLGDSSWYELAAEVVAGATLITAAFATRWPNNPVMSGVFRLLNWLAGNVFKNRNADDV